MEFQAVRMVSDPLFTGSSAYKHYLHKKESLFT